jgi:hypothetical protein
MLTTKQTEELIAYHDGVCNMLIKARKEAQGLPPGNWVKYLAKRFEGRLIAIRKIVEILGLPREFLSHREIEI